MTEYNASHVTRVGRMFLHVPAPVLYMKTYAPSATPRLLPRGSSGSKPRELQVYMLEKAPDPSKNVHLNTGGRQGGRRKPAIWPNIN